MESVSKFSWLRSPYFLCFAAVYLLNLLLANQLHLYETGNAVGILLIFGFGLTGIAWLLTRKAPAPDAGHPPQTREPYLLAALVVFITFAIVSGNRFLFYTSTESSIATELVTISRKVLTFVLIPFCLYKLLYKFGWADFGLSGNWKNVLTRRNLLLFFVMSGLVLALNYFAGNGAKPIRDGLFSAQQLVLGLPLLFLWLYIEVGLVEEFFFRGLLQNRLTVLLNSNLGAICISALVFGLVHAPGMYLRGAGELDGLGASPSLMTCMSYCLAVQAVPAFFFGIIWTKTKNLWLLMGIHAMMDLLPGFADFVKIWGI